MPFPQMLIPDPHNGQVYSDNNHFPLTNNYQPELAWYQDVFNPALNRFVTANDAFTYDLNEWLKKWKPEEYGDGTPTNAGLTPEKENIIKATWKDITDKAKDIVIDVKGSFDWTKTKILFAPLKIFKPAMVKVLRKKGISTSLSDSTVKTSILFYDTIVMGKNSLEYRAYNHADEDTEGEYTSDYMKALLSDPTTVNVILQSILAFFSAIKAKKDSGQPLNDNEKLAASEIDVNKEVTTDKEPIEWGNTLRYIVGAIVLFFVAKKVFKF